MSIRHLISSQWSDYLNATQHLFTFAFTTILLIGLFACLLVLDKEEKVLMIL